MHRNITVDQAFCHHLHTDLEQDVFSLMIELTKQVNDHLYTQLTYTEALGWDITH